MKRKLGAVLLVIALALSLGLVPAVPAAAHVEGNPQVQTLYAGQDIDVGTVSVWNDEVNLYVKYETTGGWEMTETHLHVTGGGLWKIPQTKKNNPIPSRFNYQMEHDPPITEYTYVIDLHELWPPGQDLYIAAHAKVQDGIQESAWGEGIRFVTRGNWATYFTYTVQ